LLQIVLLLSSARIREAGSHGAYYKDGLNKSCFVIPANAGIHKKSTAWTPAFAGVTTCSDIP
jgi:hypothetical protein